VSLFIVVATTVVVLLRRVQQREADAIERRKAADAARLFSTTVVESVPGVIYLYDEQGRFLRWNRQLEQVSGYTGEEIARMHPLDFFRPADRAVVAARVGEVFATGASSIEIEFVAKDGIAKPYFFTGTRVQHDGKTCLVGMGIDVSERKRVETALRESEQRFHAFMDATPAIAWMTDEEGRHLYMNRAWDRAFGLRREEWFGKTAFDLVPADAAERIKASDEEVLRLDRAVEIPDDTGFIRGQPFHWNCFKFPFRSAAGQRLVGGIAIDITERRVAEQQRAQLAEQEREARIAAEAAEAARARAEAADRVKSAFLATMSHELRTPLNSIIGFTGIVLQGLAGPLTAEQTRQLGMVRSSARHLLELIGDVLDISKIEAGQLEMRVDAVDLRASIDRVVDAVRPMLDKKGLALTVTVPGGLAPIVSDRRRVEQVLLNLLNNAIKFTDEGRVTLSVETVEAFRQSPDDPPQDAVRIDIADTGIGIKAADLGSLFQPFRQIDTGLTRQHEGTGLGLAICRRLTEKLGGAISVDSEWRKGSVFSVTLPATYRTGPS
jgi:PAS domain S-box-containing protein